MIEIKTILLSVIHMPNVVYIFCKKAAHHLDEAVGVRGGVGLLNGPSSLNGPSRHGHSILSRSQ